MYCSSEDVRSVFESLRECIFATTKLNGKRDSCFNLAKQIYSIESKINGDLNLWFTFSLQLTAT
jgi:hypothetical protein